MHRFLFASLLMFMNFAHATPAPSGFSPQDREQLERLLGEKERAEREGKPELFPPYRRAHLDGLQRRLQADQGVPVPEEARIVIGYIRDYLSLVRQSVKSLDGEIQAYGSLENARKANSAGADTYIQIRDNSRGLLAHQVEEFLKIAGERHYTAEVIQKLLEQEGIELLPENGKARLIRENLELDLVNPQIVGGR